MDAKLASKTFPSSHGWSHSKAATSQPTVPPLLLLIVLQALQLWKSFGLWSSCLRKASSAEHDVSIMHNVMRMHSILAIPDIDASRAWACNPGRITKSWLLRKERKHQMKKKTKVRQLSGRSCHLPLSGKVLLGGHRCGWEDLWIVQPQLSMYKRDSQPLAICSVKSILCISLHHHTLYLCGSYRSTIDFSLLMDGSRRKHIKYKNILHNMTAMCAVEA